MTRRFPSAPACFGLFLLALISACHLTGPGDATLSVEADASLTGNDRVVVILQDLPGGPDTLFDAKLGSLGQLENLKSKGYDGRRVLIVIQGFKDGLLVYEEHRDFNGGSEKLVSREVVLDLVKPASQGLDIRPDRIRLYAGGGTFLAEAHPLETWKGKALQWATGDPRVATVSQSGELTPVGVGVTFLRASSGDTLHDASAVQVVIDAPRIDAGAPDTAVRTGDTVVFRAKVTQEHGDVKAFAWDLDGDGTYEDSAAGAPGQTDFAAMPKVFATEGQAKVRFRARDSEGNASIAEKAIKVTSIIPRISGYAAEKAVISIKDSITFSAGAKVPGGTLRGYAFDFDGDGKDDASGPLAGDTASVTGGFRYPDAGPFKARLKVTDEAGTTVIGTVEIRVKLDKPVADAGPDIPAGPGAQVRLQGRAADTLGSIALREWKCGSGEFAAVGEDGVHAFTAPTAPGEFACVFRVTDDDGLRAEDEVKVTVNDARSPALGAPTPSDAIITIKDSLEFSLHSAAAEADLKSYTVDFDGDGKADAQGALSGRAADIKVGRRFHVQGEFNVSFRVDDQGGRFSAAQARVNVKYDAPKANAGKDTAVPASGRILLHGLASDSLGKIVEYAWNIGGKGFVATSGPDTSFNAPPDAAVISCVFRATDDDGLVALDTMVVTVGASGNADLSGLTLSIGTLAPAFTAANQTYAASVPNGTTSLTVTASSASGGAAIKVNGNAVPTGQASPPVNLDVGNNPIKVEVTAQDGVAKKTYTLTVNRAGNGNATLSGLAISAGTLAPVFSAAVTAYSASVPNGTATINVTATAADAGSTLKVGGNTATSANAIAVNLNIGVNTIPVEVTAQDGVTKLVYTITVTRTGSANADLTGLALSAGTLAPAFTAANGTYTASVTNGTASITATPSTAAGAGSTIRVNTVVVASGSASAPINLNVGANTVTVEVTAQDGTTKKVYTVTVTRAGSNNADLSALAVAGATLAPAFSAAVQTYTAGVPNTMATAGVTATAAGTGATWKVTEETSVSGNVHNVPLNTGANALHVEVTAQDGTTKKTYTVTVTRAGSNVADLSGLTVAGVTLSPTFSSGNQTYSALVPNSLATASITATLTGPGGSVRINSAAAISGSPSNVNLRTGSNVIPVEVTAQDGATKKTYTVTLTRAISTNASLNGLAVSTGSLSPGFSSGVFEYNVIATASSIRFTAIAADTASILTIGGELAKSGVQTPAIDLQYGFNPISIDVLAEDRSVEQNYVVTVFREAPANFFMAYSYVSSPGTSGALTGAFGNYNPSGGAITYTRMSTGVSRINYAGLGSVIGGKAHLQVTTLNYTGTGTYCNSYGTTIGADLMAEIRCFDKTGAPTDAMFYALVMNPRSHASGGNAFLWANQYTETASYHPYPEFSYNSSGKDIDVQRTKVGSYSVTLKGQYDAAKVNAGNFMVTGYGIENKRCGIGGWYGDDASKSVIVTVNCYTANGTAADALFDLAFWMHPVSPAIGMGAAYVSGNSADLRGTYSFNSGGGAIKSEASTTTTGQYTVTFAGLGTVGSGRDGVVVVTAYGSTGANCHPAGHYYTNDLVATVECNDGAGNPVFSSFDIWIVK